MRKLLFWGVVAVLFAFPASAGFVDLGFEAGSGVWDFYIPGGSPGGAGGAGATLRDGEESWWESDWGYIYPAPEGDAYLELRPDGPDRWTVASQVAELLIEETVSGMAAFDSQDYLRDIDYNFDPWGGWGNDRAAVKIFSGAWTPQEVSVGDADPFLVVSPWSRDVAGVGDFSDDPWATWTATLSPGTYTLSYQTASGLMGANLDAEALLYKSHALFDATPIPEVPTFALVLSGFILFILWGEYYGQKPIHFDDLEDW